METLAPAPAVEAAPVVARVTDAQVAEQFYRNLRGNAEAKEYLKARGITKEMAMAHDVGFCPPYSRPQFALLKGRVTVTIRDVHGEIIAFAGRIFEPMKAMTERALWEAYGHKPGEAQKRIDMWNRGKWLNEPYAKSRHLFNLDKAKDAARELGYIVLVEGYMDALVLAAHGITNVVAVCGTALSARHAALLTRYCKHVIVMLDGDEAGKTAAERMLPTLEEAELIPHRVVLPPGCDPDELVLALNAYRVRTMLDNVIANNLLTLNINKF